MVTGNPRIFFFKELLDEVYLLLDHVSRQNNQSLTTLTAKGDNRPALVLPGQEGEPTLQAILAHVAKLRLPPAGDENRQAEDAAFLLMLRDRLSSMVAPANGLSIAFTTMTVGFMRLPHRWRRRRSPLVPGYSLRRDMAMSAYPTLARPAQATSSFITLLILGLLLLGGLIVGLSGAATYGRSLLQQLAEANRAQATAQQMIETAQPAAAPGLPSP
ncbi:hypothetical protein, partial [Teichococcus deserti]|uniref:hypothetical protein n=1 Tax=Teichococcus deserti TaxID=1817963 RepID=UPI0010552860